MRKLTITLCCLVAILFMSVGYFYQMSLLEQQFKIEKAQRKYNTFVAAIMDQRYLDAANIGNNISSEYLPFRLQKSMKTLTGFVRHKTDFSDEVLLANDVVISWFEGELKIGGRTIPAPFLNESTRHAYVYGQVYTSGNPIFVSVKDMLWFFNEQENKFEQVTSQGMESIEFLGKEWLIYSRDLSGGFDSSDLVLHHLVTGTQRILKDTESVGNTCIRTNDGQVRSIQTDRLVDSNTEFELLKHTLPIVFDSAIDDACEPEFQFFGSAINILQRGKGLGEKFLWREAKISDSVPSVAELAINDAIVVESSLDTSYPIFSNTRLFQDFIKGSEAKLLKAPFGDYYQFSFPNQTSPIQGLYCLTEYKTVLACSEHIASEALFTALFNGRLVSLGKDNSNHALTAETLERVEQGHLNWNNITIYNLNRLGSHLITLRLNDNDQEDTHLVICNLSRTSLICKYLQHKGARISKQELTPNKSALIVQTTDTHNKADTFYYLLESNELHHARESNFNYLNIPEQESFVVVSNKDHETIITKAGRKYDLKFNIESNAINWPENIQSITRVSSSQALLYNGHYVGLWSFDINKFIWKNSALYFDNSDSEIVKNEDVIAIVNGNNLSVVEKQSGTILIDSHSFYHYPIYGVKLINNKLTIESDGVNFNRVLF